MKILQTSSILTIALFFNIAQANQDSIEELQKEVAYIKSLLELNKQNKNISEPMKVKSKSDTEIDIYGLVRLDATYQSSGSDLMFNNINVVPLKNTDEASLQKERFKSTPAVTRLGLDFKTSTDFGAVKGKVEMDFLGGANRDQFRLRHAYLTYDKWLIGQTWSNFITPSDFMPESVDGLGFVGGSLLRTPMIKYTDSLKSNINYSISIEDQKYLGFTEPDNKIRLPSLTGKLSYSFTDGIISGRTFLAEKRTSHDDNIAWGVGLGAKYQITSKLLLKSDYYHVKGDGRNVFWSNNGYAIDENNKMHSNEFDSILLGATYQFNSKLRSTLGYGHMIAKDDNKFSKLSYSNPNQNKELWQGWINMFYSPVKPISFGAEYVYGERTTFDNRIGEDSRFNMMAMYSF